MAGGGGRGSIAWNRGEQNMSKSFSAENLELVSFLFLMLGNEEKADCMCVAPFPPTYVWAVGFLPLSASC